MRYAIPVGMLAILVALAGCGGGGKSPSEQLRPTVTNVNAPSPPDSDGGLVHITATINDPNGLLAATATVEAPDSLKSNLNMIRSTSSHTYSADYTASANTSDEAAAYSVVITAVNGVGNSTVTNEYPFYVPTAWFTTASGAKYRDLQPGVDPAAQAGDTLSMYYEGRLDNGDLFQCNFTDHNPDPNENPYYYWRYPDHEGKWVQGPFTFTVGTGQVIQGWDEGVPGMKTNTVRELEIPPELGYGDQEKPNIPPNSTLHFTILLDSVGQ